MLGAEGLVQDLASQAMRREHPSYDWPKLDVTVIKLCGNRTRELDLIGLEAMTTLINQDPGTW
jgi:hypothetical protein